MSSIAWLFDAAACTDCYLAAAGVWEPGEHPAEPLTGIRQGERAEPGWRFPTEGMRANPDGKNLLGFSRNPCNLCDSRLAGDRFAVSVWEFTDAHARIAT